MNAAEQRIQEHLDQTEARLQLRHADARDAAAARLSAIRRRKAAGEHLDYSEESLLAKADGKVAQ